ESLRERADSLERELQLLAERAEERAEWARGEDRTRLDERTTHGRHHPRSTPQARVAQPTPTHPR
ncbi:hypothetical protein, partial [Streptomyces sp. NPDC004976]